jgi:hypothetical protein
LAYASQRGDADLADEAKRHFEGIAPAADGEISQLAH